MEPDLKSQGIKDVLLGIRSTRPAVIASLAIQPEKRS